MYLTVVNRANSVEQETHLLKDQHQLEHQNLHHFGAPPVLIDDQDHMEALIMVSSS